ncbi:MAG TPA: DUF72 domain-containing protein [Chitinophagaceae bacterium]|nr:DUF72 domain-containing protein [Chitinophagaceae bacterium]
MSTRKILGWKVGCSGFHYDDWKGTFYPVSLPKKKWFDYYSQRFNSLELNVTFYRFPQFKFFQNWYNNSPQDFIFSVKVPRLITHYKQFRETERMLNDFYHTCRSGLADKLGCVLFQLPPQLQYSERILEIILGQIDTSFENVIEFRHPSWWNKKVYSLLEKNNVVFCSHSYPGLPEEIVINSSLVYYRFHGVPVLYYSQYKRKFLEEVISTIQQSEKVEKAFLYFNNTATIAAIRNASHCQKLVGINAAALSNPQSATKKPRLKVGGT